MLDHTSNIRTSASCRDLRGASRFRPAESRRRPLDLGGPRPRRAAKEWDLSWGGQRCAFAMKMPWTRAPQGGASYRAPSMSAHKLHVQKSEFVCRHSSLPAGATLGRGGGLFYPQYRCPGSSRRPSACWAGVIATRPYLHVHLAETPKLAYSYTALTVAPKKTTPGPRSAAVAASSDFSTGTRERAGDLQRVGLTS